MICLIACPSCGCDSVTMIDDVDGETMLECCDCGKNFRLYETGHKEYNNN